MPYNIKKADGTHLVTVQDNTINLTASSLSLIGRNALNFGQSLDENFISLLQTFSNNMPPANPLQGQLWYNPSLQTLSVYNGSRWKIWTPPFDGKTGVASINLTSVSTILFASVTQNKIMSVTSNKAIPGNLLPSYLMINGIQYNFASLFSNGIVPGINIPFQYSNDFSFGTSISSNSTEFGNKIGLNGIITKTNTFSNYPILNLTDALTGNVTIIGNSNVNLATSFSNVYIEGNTTVKGIWSKVIVGNIGLVSNVGNINTSDIFNALKYPTIDSNLISVTNSPNTMVARDSNANFQSNIMVGTATNAFAFKKPVMLGFNGDIIGSSSFDGSSNITIKTSRSNVVNLTSGIYNVLNVNNKGRVVAAMVVDNMPIASIVLLQSHEMIPNGWTLCYGQTINLPSGGTIVVPNLSNVFVGGCQYILRFS